jgi:hypothetical protein
MKYKVLKSVAHNTAHSFVSLMNWRDGDYFMNHLTRAALDAGADELRADLLTGDSEPDALLPAPVRASVGGYAKWFPDLLRSHRVEPGAVTAASLRLRLALRAAAPAADARLPRRLAVPYECVVALTDDRGTVHVGRVAGEWAVDLHAPPPARGEAE